jgi:hypothetical protein
LSLPDLWTDGSETAFYHDQQRINEPAVRLALSQAMAAYDIEATLLQVASIFKTMLLSVALWLSRRLG